MQQTRDQRLIRQALRERSLLNRLEAAGFKLEAKSEVNANAKDNAEHKGGVVAFDHDIIDTLLNARPFDPHQRPWYTGATAWMT